MTSTDGDHRYRDGGTPEGSGPSAGSPSRPHPPAAAVGSRPPRARRPTAQSWAFTALVGLLTFHFATGIGSWVGGELGLPLVQLVLGRWHAWPLEGTIALTVFVTTRHVLALYGPRAALAFVGCLLGGVAVVVLLIAPWPVHPLRIALPFALYFVLRWLLARPGDGTYATSVPGGAAATAALWIFFFTAYVAHTQRRWFYDPIPFRFTHVLLAVVVAVTLRRHVRRARRKELWPSPAQLRVRAAALAVGLATASAAIVVDGRRLAPLFHPAPGGSYGDVSFPVDYDLRQAAVGASPAVDPGAVIAPSASCGEGACHADTFRQWAISSHRYAATTAPYRKVIALVNEELGPEATITCSRCHAPLLALRGLADDPDDRSLDPLRAEGVACPYCHVVDDGRRTAGPGGEPTAARVNGELRLRIRPDASYGLDPVGPDGAALAREAILSNLTVHNSAYHLDEQGAVCLPCHSLVAPPEWPNHGTVVREIHAGSLDRSRGAGHGDDAGGVPAAPGARDAREGDDEGDVRCGACHMILADYWGQVHTRPDHRMLGANNALEVLVRPPFSVEENLAEHTEATVAFLEGSYRMAPYEDRYERVSKATVAGTDLVPRTYESQLRHNPKIEVELDGPASVAAGSAATFAVTLTNRTGAHEVPSGPEDLNQYWIELQVTDAGGATLFRSGALDAERRLPPDAVTLGKTLLDSDGRPLRHHRIWDVRGALPGPTLAVGETFTHAFAVPLPPALDGPLAVRAALHYRRYGQEIADWIYDGDGTTFPVHTFDEATLEIAVAPASSAAAEAGDAAVLGPGAQPAGGASPGPRALSEGGAPSGQPAS